MLYCNVVDNEIKTAPRGLPLDLEGKSENELNSLGWFKAIFLTMPHMLTPDIVTEIIKLEMELVDNIVQCTYVIKQKPEIDIIDTQKLLMNMVRNQRNEKLSECDWTQLSDNVLTDDKKNQWRTYRQQLRDFPENVNLSNIIWPETPII